MSQNDFNLANDTGANYRADANSALQALASTSKGPSAPSTAYTGQLWLDDDTPSATSWTLNIYDGVGWIALGIIDTTANTWQATDHVKTNVTPSFTVAINEAATVDVASATTCDIGAAASNNVRITGTTTITGLGTAAAGIRRSVRFAGALTLTHNATSLILPTGANITTAADDTAEFVSLGSGNWFCSRFNRKSGAALAGASNLVQRVITTLATVQTGTTTIPDDDTKPQNTEGDEYMTRAITPTSATNKLVFEIQLHVAFSVAGRPVIIALFQDTTADALAADYVYLASSSWGTVGRLRFEMVAGTTSSTTFKVRAGGITAGTLTVNGLSGARKLGGALISSITIDEIVP